MIEARGIRKTYGSHQALKGLDLNIKEGSIFGLLGPNGAGKTTFIRILNQILAPDEGEVLIKGEALSGKHISRIGYLPEERGLYPKMKIGEQLLYLAQLKGLSKSQAKERIAYWLKRFELTDRVQTKVEELSKGLAQKVQFIASVIHEPELLILDEPFTGFDPVNTEHIKQEILRLREEGATIIFSTHRMESVEELCEDIVLINKGSRLLGGPLHEVKAQYKSGWYQVETEKEWQIPTGKNWQVEKLNAQLGGKAYRIHPEQNSRAELLESLLSSGLIEFREEIPSLNEIFIQSTRNA
ncbi:ABC transporter ATP-binding protein [Croceimicrobium hydrocarbonivorans]|uniref:ATP-binding cassette domain-containing protein n=1 Tax=Croceimicrobium hydrocarbonivorans TaxID=2761580 RepID=A0A7H0VC72_9FLAO|nr:ATP-binding cassette domain-containing protein [Croceimicrobium hydrocarbonivorans]QNR23320.1 ATP-binding cassette domain-containing protein [Croceimicrobium hydrocarbonivorans]